MRASPSIVRLSGMSESNGKVKTVNCEPVALRVTLPGTLGFLVAMHQKQVPINCHYILRSSIALVSWNPAKISSLALRFSISLL